MQCLWYLSPTSDSRLCSSFTTTTRSTHDWSNCDYRDNWRPECDINDRCIKCHIDNRCTKCNIDNRGIKCDIDNRCIECDINDRCIKYNFTPGGRFWDDRRIGSMLGAMFLLVRGRDYEYNRICFGE